MVYRDFIPVSYTHLDVYKRQQLPLWTLLLLSLLQSFKRKMKRCSFEVVGSTVRLTVGLEIIGIQSYVHDDEYTFIYTTWYKLYRKYKSSNSFLLDSKLKSVGVNSLCIAYYGRSNVDVYGISNIYGNTCTQVYELYVCYICTYTVFLNHRISYIGFVHMRLCI